jgi:hypothetical protein
MLRCKRGAALGSTGPKKEPLTKATGLNAAIDLRPAPCPIERLVGD